MISDREILLRLLPGALFGGIIGFERQHHGRPAGFRTHLLVCLASALVMIVPEYFHNLAIFDPSYVRVDPGRIASGVITGIGFVGAGVIVKEGVNVHGLTTAACLWVVAAIGLALGGGLYLAAGAALFITLSALWLLERFERRMGARQYGTLSVVTEGGTPRGEDLVTRISELGSGVKGTDIEFDCKAGENTCRMTLSMRDPKAAEALPGAVGRQSWIRRFSLNR